MARLKHNLTLPPDAPHMQPVVRYRVIYGDTDRMGYVYHGTYARFLEQTRVEFLRTIGCNYAEVEAGGHGFPLINMALAYRSPAKFDDLLTISIGLAELTSTRLRFCYRITIEPGDRPGLQTQLEILRGSTWHCCIRLPDGHPARCPEPVFSLLTAKCQQMLAETSN